MKTALDIVRFIPASAGNGYPRQCNNNNSSVHPRERGERYLTSTKNGAKGGSSPRARGTGWATVITLLPMRFIPASAGNGREHRGNISRVTVHPRERGERPHILKEM